MVFLTSFLGELYHGFTSNSHLGIREITLVELLCSRNGMAEIVEEEMLQTQTWRTMFRDLTAQSCMPFIQSLF